MAKRKKPRRQAAMCKVLSDYEVGKCHHAMEAVALHGKPVVEVMTRRADRKALGSDLRKMIAHSSYKREGLRHWILKTQEGCLRYGFYVEPWALGALKFLDKAELTLADRHWISGLLFGIAPQRITEFLSRQGL